MTTVDIVVTMKATLAHVLGALKALMDSLPHKPVVLVVVVG